MVLMKHVETVIRHGITLNADHHHLSDFLRRRHIHNNTLDFFIEGCRCLFLFYFVLDALHAAAVRSESDEEGHSDCQSKTYDAHISFLLHHGRFPAFFRCFELYRWCLRTAQALCTMHKTAAHSMHAALNFSIIFSGLYDSFAFRSPSCPMSSSRLI